MGLSGILSLLKGLGKGAKETLTPIARQKTATDEYLNLQRKLPGAEMGQLDKIGAIAKKESDRLSGELTDLTHRIRVQTTLMKAGGHSAESHAKMSVELKESIDKLLAQKKNLDELFKILMSQSEGIGAKVLANKSARMNYDLEKKMSLIKGLIAGTGGVAGGMFLERALNGDEPEEAIEEMEEATQTKSRGTEVGENIANKLMDIISPIPRYK
jgi:hypothetical protein